MFSKSIEQGDRPMPKPFYTRKADAIRTAKRLGFKYVLYRRTGARLGLYTISDVNYDQSAVWTADRKSTE